MCSVLMFEHGTVVHDRYRILRPIGKGGMGAVYEALDLRLHNTVALKRMTAEGPDADRAFEREAQLLASLRYSALPAVIDYFVESDSRFLVMQYIEGEDLEHLRKREGGRCDESDVLAWGVEVLVVLAFLHRHQPPIVHRDVKPANLKLTPRGEIVLLDFGLAKGLHDAATRTVAEDQSIFGFTANYAPPEQQQGRGTDGRSDLYALGATLYHLVTGVLPAAAQVRVAAIADGLADPLVPAHAINPAVSVDLSDVLSRALRLSADARFQIAEEMMSALAGLRELVREKPRGLESRGARRIDAAMPSEAEIGRQVDLLVQVRFKTSPRLGREDWPSKRVPDAIEQASEEFDLDYPIDPRTHQQLSARLRIKLVAPDFAIAGTPESLIEVPPDAYSKRLAFLMTPRRAGLCRVHVEVHALDALHLGTVPIEVNAVGSAVTAAEQRVGHLLLQMLSRDAAARVPELFEGDADGGTVTLALAPSSLEAQLDATASDGVRERLAIPKRDSTAAPSAGRLSKSMAVVASLAILATTAVVLQRSGGMSPAPDPPAATQEPAPQLPSNASRPVVPLSRGRIVPTETAKPTSAVENALREEAKARSDSKQAPPTAAPGPRPDAGPAASGAMPASPPASATPVAPPPAPTPPAASANPAQAVAQPPPPPPPPRSDEEQAKAEISLLLERYRRAYETLDVEAVKQVFPSAPESLKNQFSQYQSIAITATAEPQFRELDATTALVDVEWRRTAVLKSNRKQQSTQRLRIQLTRKTFDNRWIIAEVRFSAAQ